jgi:recombination protein RecT
MADKKTNVPATTNGGVVQKVNPKTDALKGILNAESVQEQFKNALGKASNTFVASVIDLYNSDSNLQMCEPKAVVMEALKAAVLHLPINKALGYAYIIPYNNSYTEKDQYGKDILDERGNKKWYKKMEPTFQLGYKGYIQLAMRTGQYRTLNADVVYDGEIRKVSKLTGEIAFDGEKVSDKIAGYFCYFELLNGFSKTLYMTVEQMAKHAKRFSKGLKKDVSVERLLQLAAMPVNDDSKTVGWLGNFHAMGVKTVVRNLLSKYGYLSIEMQTAIADDMRSEDYADAQEIREDHPRLVIEAENVKTIGEAASSNNNTDPNADPGY